MLINLTIITFVILTRFNIFNYKNMSSRKILKVNYVLY